MKIFIVGTSYDFFILAHQEITLIELQEDIFYRVLKILSVSKVSIINIQHALFNISFKRQSWFTGCMRNRTIWKVRWKFCRYFLLNYSFFHNMIHYCMYVLLQLNRFDLSKFTVDFCEMHMLFIRIFSRIQVALPSFEIDKFWNIFQTDPFLPVYSSEVLAHPESRILDLVRPDSPLSLHTRIFLRSPPGASKK